MQNGVTETAWRVERRDFLKASALALAGLSAKPAGARVGAEEPAPGLRIGMVADAHYADAPPKGSRYYRESLAKMHECVAAMNRNKVDLLVALGDLKDQDAAAEETDTIRYLEEIEGVFRKFDGPRYHVLGNHDLDSLSKAQFQKVAHNTGIPDGESYYSFAAKGIHMVVLDANFRRDGVAYDHGNFDWTDTHISPRQLTWLETDLAATQDPVVVFVHQLLDGETDVCVKNASDVRQVLSRSGRVLAVFQGHHHAGQYSCLDGIHYYTLKGMVEGSGEENSAYATVDVHPDGSLEVVGYRRALSRNLKRPAG